MNMWKLIIAFLVLTSTTTYAGGELEKYGDYLDKICQKKIAVLLIKKSLIEQIKGEQCSGQFTQIILSKCSQLSCEDVFKAYRSVQLNRGRGVIGK